MLYTGDLRNNLYKLSQEIKYIQYEDKSRVKKNADHYKDVRVLLPLIHYSLLEYSRYFARLLNEKNLDVYGKDDLTFIKMVFNIMRSELKMRPLITVSQFFSNNFTERKIMLMIEFLRAIRQKHAELKGEHHSYNKNVPNLISKKKKKSFHGKKNTSFLHDMDSNNLSATLMLQDSNPITHWRNKKNKNTKRSSTRKNATTSSTSDNKRNQSISSSKEKQRNVIVVRHSNDFQSTKNQNTYTNLYQSSNNNDDRNMSAECSSSISTTTETTDGTSYSIPVPSILTRRPENRSPAISDLNSSDAVIGRMSMMDYSNNSIVEKDCGGNMSKLDNHLKQSSQDSLVVQNNRNNKSDARMISSFHTNNLSENPVDMTIQTLSHPYSTTKEPHFSDDDDDKDHMVIEEGSEYMQKTQMSNKSSPEPCNSASTDAINISSIVNQMKELSMKVERGFSDISAKILLIDGRLRVVEQQQAHHHNKNINKNINVTVCKVNDDKENNLDNIEKHEVQLTKNKYDNDLILPFQEKNHNYLNSSQEIVLNDCEYVKSEAFITPTEATTNHQFDGASSNNNGVDLSNFIQKITKRFEDAKFVIDKSI